MLGLEAKAIRITWSVLLTIGVFALIWLAREAIFLFLLAIFFAYMLSPAVAIVDRLHMRRVPRTLSLAIVYLVLLGALSWVVAAITSRASQEAANLIAKIPEWAKRARELDQVQLPSLLEPYRVQLLGFLQEQLAAGAERILPLIRAGLLQLLSALTNVGLAVLVPILSFFFIKDAEDIRRAVLGFFQGERALFWEGVLDDVHVMLGKYIRALFIVSLVTFITFEVVFGIAGLPYASLIATVSALLEFVPVLGWITSTVLTVGVAIASGYGNVALIIGFMLIYRLFQDYVLQPYLMSSGIEMHPLLVIFGVLAGEQIAGIGGMIFSIPVLAILRLIWVRATRPQL